MDNDSIDDRHYNNYIFDSDDINDDCNDKASDDTDNVICLSAATYNLTSKKDSLHKLDAKLVTQMDQYSHSPLATTKPACILNQIILNDFFRIIFSREMCLFTKNMRFLKNVIITQAELFYMSLQSNMALFNPCARGMFHLVGSLLYCIFLVKITNYLFLQLYNKDIIPHADYYHFADIFTDSRVINTIILRYPAKAEHKIWPILEGLTYKTIIMTEKDCLKKSNSVA